MRYAIQFNSPTRPPTEAPLYVCFPVLSNLGRAPQVHTEDTYEVAAKIAAALQEDDRDNAYTAVPFYG